MRVFKLLAILIFIASCSNENNKPDTSDIKVNVAIERFEADFFRIDTTDISKSLTTLNQKYPRFYPLFANEVLVLDRDHSIGADGRVQLTDSGSRVIRYFYGGYRPIYDSMQLLYKNLDWLKNDLEESFRYVKYYYPSFTAPQVITFISTFDFIGSTNSPGVVYTPKYLCIALQQFAGRNFSAYQDPVIQQIYPGYVSRRFDKVYMLPNCMKAVAADLHPDSSGASSLIEQMIEKGKQWWLVKHFIPDAPDSLITGYTKHQTEWCDDNEGNIWTSVLTGSSDLYTVNTETIQMYLGEAPTTMGMPEAAPGNIGQWVGWQIVKKFAEKNPSMKLQEVLATPARKIFQEAKYKPK